MSDQAESSLGSPVELGEGDREGRCVVARYGRMGHIGIFGHEMDPPPTGSRVVVRSERGAELAQVLIHLGGESGPWSISDESLGRYLQASGREYPLSRGGRILRVATAQDLNDQQHLDHSASEEAAFCRQRIGQLRLEMKLIFVEHLLGGERIVFYFVAEQRVDFRELVRELAERYHTRIEMRQVGARDEARLLADYERCGRQCCCQKFLKLLKPVSMRMAKSQKATLDPAKISGRCGRLMCCLRYEDRTYEELQARLPKKKTWIRTGDGVVGKVLEVQILAQLVRLGLPDQAQVVVANEDIVERDVPEPTGPPTLAERRAAAAAMAKKPPQPVEEWEPTGDSGSAEPDAPEEAGPPEGGRSAEQPASAGKSSGRRRRRRPRKNRGQRREAPSASSQPATPPSGKPPQAQSAGNSPGKKRRRRRRKRPGGSKPSGPGPQP